MRRRFLATILLAVFVLAVVALFVCLLPADTVAAPTYINGDWDINNGDVITRADEEIILSGDLTVYNGGLLTLRNVTLRMNCTASNRYQIEVQDGGRLNIYDGDGNPSTTSDASLITSNDTAHNFLFFVRDGGELYFNDSRLEECGISSSTTANRGLFLESSSCTLADVDVRNCYYGVLAYTASPTIRDCTFDDISSYAVYLYSSSTDVNGCTIGDCYRGVMAYYSYPKVTNTDVDGASNIGIYTYYGEATISGCNVDNSGSVGIYVVGSSVDVTGCTVDDSVSYGIYAASTVVTVTDCDVNDTGTGIYLNQVGTGSSVNGGKVTNCSFNGIYVYRNAPTIDRTHLYDMNTNGIYLNGGSALVIDTYVESAAVGYYVRNTGNARLVDVAAEGATTHGIEVSGGAATIEGFDVRNCANGITVTSNADLDANNGTVASSTNYDFDVDTGGVAEVANSTFSTSSMRVQGAGSALRVFWFVDVHGEWQDGSDVSGGSYNVQDRTASVVASGTLDSNGRVAWLRIRNMQVTSSGTTTDTPHTFMVSSGGLSGLRAATIDASQLVTVTVTDNVPPSGYSMNVEPLYTQGTYNPVSWTAGSDIGVGGIEYDCQMATDAGFASVVYSSGWTTMTTHTFIGLVDGTTYHYRVRARDGVGNVGLWSAGVSSTQDSSPPSVPVVVSEPAYTQGTSNTISWGTSTDGGVGSVEYRAQYTDDPTFNTVLGTGGWQSTTSATIAGLSDGTTYYYRVRARDGFGQESAWSPPVSSTQDASPPSRPAAVTLPTYTQGLSTTFEWLASTDSGVGGIEYYAECDDQWQFTSPHGSSGWITDLSYTFTGIPEDTWHYYRVRARDALGQESGWSSLTWTRQDDSPPSVPVMAVEPQYTAGNENTVSWAASSDGAGSGGVQYRVETDTSAFFSSPDFASGWTTSRSYTFSSLVDGITYYYRVRARDSLGQESSWSSTVSSTQDASPPPIPGIAAEPPYTAGTTNTVYWSEVTDAGIEGERYQVQASTTPAFSSTFATSGWLSTTSYTFSGLTDGDTYYYRVRSRDGFNQVSDWSGTTSSAQDASPPPAPTMVQQDYYHPGLYFIARWTAVTDTGVGGVEYYCEYDDVWNFASPNGNSGWTTALEHNFTGLQANRWYYYHAKARDALDQESAWSGYIYARQDNSPPTVPTMSSEPVWTAGTTNTVSWSASTDTGGIWQISYQARIGTSPSFDPPLQTSMWITQRSYTFTGLQSGVTYYYQARAKDGLDQESAWSAAVASTQDSSPPPAPTMAAEPAYTQGTSNTVSWTAVTDNSGGTVQYRVYASLSSVFATTEGDSGWRTTTTWTFSGLADGSTYHYRVKARDQFGQEGEWSNIVSSTQDATAPSGYYMITEPTYTQGTSNTVEWNPATDGGSGGVEYETEAWTYGSSGWIDQLTYTYTSLPENTWIYYRVRARDAVGNVGGWSSWTYSRQDASPPSVPTMSALPQHSQGTSIDVGWSASSDGAGIGQVTYKVQYAASGSFSPVLGESLWQSERTYTFSGLTDGQTYYFRARARDGLDQESGWSGWVSTTMDSLPPSVPFLSPEPPYTRGTTNTLEWSASTDAGVGNVQYEVQASTGPSFAPVASSSGWITGTSHTFTGLTDGQLYHYRVHARDGLRQESGWSNVERSTQDATAPPAPVIVTEPTYTAGTENTIHWGAVTDGTSGGVEYYVERDNDFFFRSVDDASGWIAATEFTFTGLAENTWWFYRVHARDAVGNVGGWSGTTWSRQDDTPPTTPTMAAEPQYTPGTTNTVGWSASTDTGGVGGIEYKAEASTSSTFTSVLSESPWLSSRSWTFAGLVDGWTYYYRVRARDALDHVSSYSNVVFSTQDASAPTAPFMTAEPEYTSGTANTVTWTAVADGGVGGVEYEVEMSTSPTFSSPTSSGWVSGTSQTFTRLSDGVRYYYRVRARDAFGQVGGWSNVVFSTQDDSPPTVPGLQAEPTYTRGTENTLHWTASTDAGVGGVEYWCEYDTSFIFTSPDGNSGWTTATEHTFNGLPENTWLFYRVRARDAFGHTSGWSATRWSRQDDSPPTTPTMRIEPAYTPGTSNEVLWTTATDAGVGGVEYRVFVDNDANMQTPMTSSGWVTGMSFTFAGLADGVTYYYAVQARDAFDFQTGLSNVVSSTQDASAPATPVMELEPEHTQGLSNTVGWSAAEDAGVGGVVYTLQWSTSSVFSTVTGEFDRLGQTSAVVSGLSDGVRYHYRVRARDLFGYTSPWSNIVWSIQDDSPPATPVMEAEPEHTPGTSNTVAWGEAKDAGVGGVEYYTEISTDGAFTNPIGSGWTTVTEWTWNNLGDGTRYWYRVRARDAFGQQTPWSAFVSSTQDDRAPPVPTLGALPTVSKGTTRGVSWNAVTDAGVGGVEYEVQCSLDANFATLHATSGWTAATSHTFSGLSDGSRYMYRVRSRDAFDHRSAWSGVRSSTQDASPPSVPSMAAEPPFTQGLSNAVSWSTSVDAGIGGVTYYAEAATDGAFTDVVGTYGWGTATTATFTGLADGETYYFRVRARDAYDYRSPWSNAVWSTQDASPPSRPVMAPEPVYTPGTTNTVSWSLSIDTGVGGVLYYVEWDTTPNFASPDGASGWVPVREWTFPNLPEMQNLYYHVRARDALMQTSAWSEWVRSQQDASPPRMPSLNELPEFTKGTAVAVSWMPAVDLGVGGVEYWSEWDDDPGFSSPGGTSGWVSSATHTFGGIPEGVVIYFRVRARDAFDHVTQWADVERTTCDASPPSVPYLASEPIFTKGTTNQLTWSTAIDTGIGGVQYRCQATSDPTWTVVEKESTWLQSTSHTFSGLSDGSTYYYRVQSRDAFSWTSTWSPVVSSTQDASAPPVPSATPLPAYTEGLEVAFRWGEVVDAGVGGVEYMAEVSPVASFSTLLDSSDWTRDTTWTFSDLTEGVLLYYRVRSRDSFDHRSSWSVSVNTTLDASPPLVPLLDPEPDHTAGSENTVGWLASQDAGVGGVEYLVEASTGPSFSDLVAASDWMTQTSYTFRMLGDGVTYHYRVRARDAFDHRSGWSSPVSSTQDGSPPEVGFDPLPEVISATVHEVTGGAVDAGSGVDTVEVSTDGGSTWSEATYSSGTWSWTWTGYASGEHQLMARATDRLGNRLNPPVAAMAVVDLDAPVASIGSPKVNETLTGLVPVQGTASDPHLARYNLYWTVDDVQWVPIVADQRVQVVGGNLAIWDTRALDDGEYRLVLEVNDTSGRTTRANVTCYLLNSAVLISPGDLFLSDPFPYEGDNITITASFRNAGTSDARDVVVTVTDNGDVLYESVADIGPGETFVVRVPYVVPDHDQLHTIRARAVYDDNPDPMGNAASTSYQGREVVVEPFFDTSEWALFGMFLAILVALLVVTWLTWRRIASAPSGPGTGLPVRADTFETMEPLGADQIQWDDDSF